MEGRVVGIDEVRSGKGRDGFAILSEQTVLLNWTTALGKGTQTFLPRPGHPWLFTSRAKFIRSVRAQQVRISWWQEKFC